MKLVSAVLRPQAYSAVQDALRTFGILGLTVTEVLDRSGRTHGEVYRGRRFQVDLCPHVQLDIVADDSDALDIARIVARVLDGRECHGRVWITPVEALIRVRTGQRGLDAPDRRRAGLGSRRFGSREGRTVGAGTPGIIGTRGTPSGPAAPLGRRARAALVACGIAAVLALAAATAWAVADPNRYVHSADGCVSVAVPSTTGGAFLHACGDQARAMCRTAFAAGDRIAAMTRPECVAAGLTPVSAGAGP